MEIGGLAIDNRFSNSLVNQREQVMSLTINGTDIEEQKPFIPATIESLTSLNKDNFHIWDFGRLNMLFGTDSQPFVTFVNQEGNCLTMGIKSNMSIRNHQSVTRLDQERLVFSGGVNHLFNHVTSKTYEYNIRTSKFKKMGSLINRRFFAQMVFTRGRLFIIGGRDYGNDAVAILNSCEEYNFGNQQWTQIANLNFSRCNFSSIIFRDDIFVFSGLSKTSELINHIEKFDFERSRWEVLGLDVSENMLGNLSFHRGNEIVVLGGTRAWGPGSIIRLDMELGADLGHTEIKTLNKKNALSKPIVLDKFVLAVGGFFSNNVLLDKETLEAVQDTKRLSKYKHIIDHVEKLCMQNFRLTKCSYVLPLENAGGVL